MNVRMTHCLRMSEMSQKSRVASFCPTRAVGVGGERDIRKGLRVKMDGLECQWPRCTPSLAARGVPGAADIRIVADRVERSIYSVCQMGSLVVSRHTRSQKQ